MGSRLATGSRLAMGTRLASGDKTLNWTAIRALEAFVPPKCIEF